MFTHMEHTIKSITETLEYLENFKSKYIENRKKKRCFPDNTRKTKDSKGVLSINHCNVYKVIEKVNTDYYFKLVI